MAQAVYYLISTMREEQRIQDELAALKNASLYRKLKSVAGDQGPVLTVDGREVLNFSSNN
jgi:7-keto-8-aminopelargonate synthetase-like enzyme